MLLTRIVEPFLKLRFTFHFCNFITYFRNFTPKHLITCPEAYSQKSSTSRRLKQIEDAMHLLGMTIAPRSRGRKASGYCKISSVDEIKKVTG